LINDERQRFGIGEAIALPGQDLLKPLMVQAQALGLVEQGNALARTGAISEAVAHFETALALDPTLHLTPEPYARRVLSNTVQALLFAGRQAAQAGQLETALAKFTEAAALDVAALTAEVTDLAVAALVEQGRNLAQEGQLEEALAKFTEAAALDETLDVAALTAEAKRLAATAQLVQSLEQVRILADQGDFAASGARLRDLATQVPLLTVGVVVTATTALTPLWRFDGSSGQTVTLTMVDTEDDDFDPYLTLIKPTGELGAEDDDSGGGSDGYDARIADLLLPADGVYFVLAGRPDNDVLYALTLTVQEPTERQPLATPSPTATATRR
jgi:tetratricopeptide (TPR) repeat protein